VAREFAESVLGHLNQADERGQLRQTLRAYFASSQNGASAAAALGVHEQTVSRRLSAIERLIGSPVNQRRAELELALRLEEVLTP
jgi:DNA-binding PucR family transcriptional regulator